MPFLHRLRQRLRVSLTISRRKQLFALSAIGIFWLLTLSAGAWQDPALPQQTPGARPAGVRPKRSKPNPDAPRKAAGQAAGANEIEAAQLSSSQPILATADFNLAGLVVTAAPEAQTVPKNTATIINTGILAPDGADPSGIIAGLNPNWRVRGELSGPSLPTPLALEASIGQPLPIPPLPNVGDHAVQNLRVVDISQAGQPTVMTVSPDACGIVVIERILVSEVRVNQMTYEQIVQSGINLADDSYNYFNFVLGRVVSFTASVTASSLLASPIVIPSSFAD